MQSLETPAQTRYSLACNLSGSTLFNPCDLYSLNNKSHNDPTLSGWKRPFLNGLSLYNTRNIRQDFLPTSLYVLLPASHLGSSSSKLFCFQSSTHFRQIPTYVLNHSIILSLELIIRNQPLESSMSSFKERHPTYQHLLDHHITLHMYLSKCLYSCFFIALESGRGLTTSNELAASYHWRRRPGYSKTRFYRRFQSDLSCSPSMLYYCEQLPHGTYEIVMVYSH